MINKKRYAFNIVFMLVSAITILWAYMFFSLPDLWLVVVSIGVGGFMAFLDHVFFNN